MVDFKHYIRRSSNFAVNCHKYSNSHRLPSFVRCRQQTDLRLAPFFLTQVKIEGRCWKSLRRRQHQKIIGKFLYAMFGTPLCLGWREPNTARLKSKKIPVFIVSKLEIRQYICVSPLQKHKNFSVFKVGEFRRSFFYAAKCEIARKANAYG